MRRGGLTGDGLIGGDRLHPERFGHGGVGQLTCLHVQTCLEVGIVGAGGIGATLANAFGRYDYYFALAITIVIVGVILFSEAVSGVIRKRIQ